MPVVPAFPGPVAPRRGRVLATVTAAQVLSVASATVVAVALPSLGRDLGAGGTELQWVVDAFVLVFASLLVAGGVIGDRRGRRLAFLAGLTLFAAGSLWCAVAPSVEWLLAGRVVQALGPPLVLPASLAIVTNMYTTSASRARAIGLWGGRLRAGAGARPAARRADRRGLRLALGLRRERPGLRAARRPGAARDPAGPPGRPPRTASTAPPRSC